MKKEDPWYRHRWPWILIAGPAAVVVAGLVTAWLAFRTADGLVEDDYYKQGLAVNQRMQRDSEAAARGLSGELMLGADGKMLRFLLNGDARTAKPGVLVLHLAHPTRSGMDQQVRMTLGADGFHAASLQKVLSGRWHVVLDDGEGKWRLVGEWYPEHQPVLHLSPGS